MRNGSILGPLIAPLWYRAMARVELAVRACAFPNGYGLQAPTALPGGAQGLGPTGFYRPLASCFRSPTTGPSPKHPGKWRTRHFSLFFELSP